MPLLVQTREHGKRMRTYKAVVTDPEDPIASLEWELVAENQKRDRRLPLIRKAAAAPWIGGIITQKEAEEATGIYPPGCWDYILEHILE